MTDDLTYFQNNVADGRAITLLKGIVEENRRSLRLEQDRLAVTTQKGRRYYIELRTAKVYNDAGKSVCVRVLTPNLPVIDQVIAKSLYLLVYPDPSLSIDHDLLFKLTFVGVEPRVEWPWMKSMSYSTLGETFSSLIGADFAVKEIRIRDIMVKLQMWYVNYDAKFKLIRVRHVKGSMGGVILCTSNGDLRKIGDFQTSIEELRSCNSRRLPLVFIGLYSEAGTHGRHSEALELGEEIAKCNEIPFFPCSIEHPSMTRKPLTYLVEAILNRRTMSSISNS